MAAGSATSTARSQSSTPAVSSSSGRFPISLPSRQRRTQINVFGPWTTDTIPTGYGYSSTDAPASLARREESDMGGGGMILTVKFAEMSKDTPEQLCKQRIDEALQQRDYDLMKQALEECKDQRDLSRYLVPSRDVGRLTSALRRYLVAEIKEMQREDAPDRSPQKIASKIAELKGYGASLAQIAELEHVTKDYMGNPRLYQARSSMLRPRLREEHQPGRAARQLPSAFKSG